MKYRYMPINPQRLGYAEWTEIEAEPESDTIYLLQNNAEVTLERWSPRRKAWVGASWRALSPSEQSVIIERSKLIGEVAAKRKKAQRGVEAAVAEIAAIDSELEAIEARKAAAESRRAAALAQAESVEDEARMLDRRIAELTKDMDAELVAA
jgi:hypothetical protein